MTLKYTSSLGSKVGIHKTGTFYFAINNFPIHFNVALYTKYLFNSIVLYHKI